MLYFLLVLRVFIIYLSKEYSYRVVSLLQDKDFSFIKYNFKGNTKLADLCELQNRKKSITCEYSKIILWWNQLIIIL